MARLQTNVDSLTFSQGRRDARPWNWRVVEPVPSSPQAIAKGSLFVLLELGGAKPASPRLYRLLLNTIQGVYYDAAGGITGGLTEAVLAAHHALEQNNALYPDEEQQGGVSCAVLRGEELYLAVGGPAMVVVGHPGRVEQFPAEISPVVNPLGGPEAPTIEIFRSSVSNTALVVQLQSEWVARVPARKLASVALAPDLPTVMEYLETVAPGEATLSALAVEITPQPVEAAATPTEVEPEAGAQPADEAVVEAEAADGAAAPAQTVAAAPATEPPGRTRRRLSWALLLLVPLAITLIIAGGYWWQQRALQEEVTTLLQGAEAALTAATQEGVPEDTARQQLADAEERLQQALTLQPANEQAVDLQARIQAALDRINQVVPLYKMVTLREFGGQGSNPARVTVQGNRVYILDDGVDHVMRYGLDEVSGLIPEGDQGIVAQRGQTLPNGQVIGELIDMAWAPAGGARRSSNLLILDSNRNLLQLDDALGVQPLVLGGQDKLQTPRLISSYNGNLYVLDSGAGRIWRYLPTADGYSGDPENYFEGDASIDLTQVVDMGIDGNIWLLYSDGRIQTFLSGRQQPLELEPVPNGALEQPQAMFVGSEAGSAQDLFVGDGGQGRIVAYGKDGAYQRQFVPDDERDQERLRQTTDLQVDEINRLFYILTKDALLQTDIPQ